MTSKPIFIYGAGGLGREVLSIIKALPEWKMAGFIDDIVPRDTVINGYPVKGGIEYLNNYPEFIHVAIALGDPVRKQEVTSRISNKQINYPALQHPRSLVQNRESVMIGKGSILCAGAIITTNISIGEFVLLNLNTTVGHDCTIGNYCSVMPGCNIAGNVSIESLALVGSGSNIRNRVRIGTGAVVGMGSVVLENVDANSVVAGVPAKRLHT